jgi:hypothetical protein
LGEKPWPKQEEIMRAVERHPRVTVRSGHGVGKTRCAAALAVWFLAEHRPSLVVTTAPTFRQVRDVLWPEIRRLWARLGPIEPEEKSAPKPRTNMTEIRVDEQRRAFGFATNEPQRLQGMHCENILVIVDEAGGVEDRLYESVQGLLTSRNARLLLIGNPVRMHGFFRDSHRPESGFARMHISCIESPNVIEGRCVIPGLVTREWVEEQKRQWGEHTEVYRARVLGEFPTAPNDALIPPEWLEAAQRRAPPPLCPGRLRLGVDVARQGEDRTAFVLRDDAAVRLARTMRIANLTLNGDHVRDFARQHRLEHWQVFMDTCGIGIGVADCLARSDFPVNHVNFGSAATSKEMYRNVRAEAYWELRKALDPGGTAALCLPPEQRELIEECRAMRYEMTDGAVRIVAKDEIARELRRSPDLADALALTFAPGPPTPHGWRA